MAERTSRREEEKDVDPKSELGGNDDTEWLKDPKTELGGGNNTDWLKDPKSELGVTSAGNDEALERPTDDFAGVLPPFADDPTVDAAAIDVGPIGREGGDEGDPAGLDVGPISREGSGGDEGDRIGIMPLPSPMPAPDEGDPAAVVWPDYQEGPGEHRC